MHTVRLLPLLVPALLLGGCDKQMPKIPKNLAPQAKFEQMKVKEIDFEGAQTVFIFEVKNPYPLGLKLTELNWNLGLAGNALLDGTNDQGIDIEAGGASAVKIPVAVKFADIFAVAADAKGKGEVPWELTGNFAFDTPVGNVALPFTETGVMPALTAPRIKLEGVRLGKLDLASQSAQLFIDVGIESDEEKPLSFKKFAYGLSLGGAQVASGESIMQPITDGKTNLEIPLSVRLLDLGDQVVKAIKNKDEIRVGIDTDAEVDTPFGIVPLKVSKTKKLQLK